MSIGDKFQVASGNGNKELRFSVGEKIVFLRNGTVEGKEGVKNGLFGNITSIDKSTLTIRTQEGDSSRYIKVDTSKYNSLDYGYATTVHKSQGTTIDNTIMYINSKGWNKNLSYVGMSRHKYNLDMYVNKDVYGDSDILKRSLSSNSRKEIDVSKFIERKPTEAFIERLKSGIRGSSFQIKQQTTQGYKEAAFLIKSIVTSDENIQRLYKMAKHTEPSRAKLFDGFSQELQEKVLYARSKYNSIEKKRDGLLCSFAKIRDSMPESIKITKDYHSANGIYTERERSDREMEYSEMER